jgi:hypothetical protein
VTRLASAAPTRALLRTLIATALVAVSLAWVATRPRPQLSPVRSSAVELDEPWEDVGAVTLTR